VLRRRGESTRERFFNRIFKEKERGIAKQFFKVSTSDTRESVEGTRKRGDDED